MKHDNHPMNGTVPWMPPLPEEVTTSAAHNIVTRVPECDDILDALGLERPKEKE